jgi:hypothetical protein
MSGIDPDPEDPDLAALLAQLASDDYLTALDDLPDRRCGHCDAPLEPRRSDALYCSGRCRVAAFRARTHA